MDWKEYNLDNTKDVCGSSCTKIDFPTTGWICPVCGVGNSPWSNTCSCKGQQQYTYYYHQQTYITCPICGKVSKLGESCCCTTSGGTNA